MDMTLFIILMFGLQGFYWFLGRRSSKNLAGDDDYFLAGKKVKLFPLMMTFLATQVGGGLVLGAADEAFRFGWPVLLYPLGASLGLIVLGMGVGRRLAAYPISTVAQIFEVVYRSPVLKRAASLLSVISLFMILVAQIIASSKFLVSLGVDNTGLFIAFWAIVIFYTVQGGLRAVISTDLAQAAVFSLVFMVCFGFVLYTEPSSTALPLPRWESFELVSSKLCGWLLMPLLFMLIEQDMGQRCFAGASPKVVSRASLFAGIATLAICAVPVFFGTLANTLAIEVPPGGSVLMAIIAKTTTPWMTALVGCAILAAIISTATSLINAMSSNLASDFQLNVFKNVSPLRFAQMITAILSVSAIFFAFYFDNIVDVLIQSYELSVSCLFVPIFAALFKKQGNFISAVLGILCGLVGFVLFRLYPMPVPREVLSLLLSFAGYVVGEVVVSARQRLKGIAEIG